MSDGPPDDDGANGFDDDFDDDFGPDDDGFDDVPLDERESLLVRQDLSDLADFEQTFAPEGFRGVAVFCQDCVEEHYYPWDMLRENLELLLETGETPVHEPAYAPEPDRYIPWDYARGYIDALRDAGVDQRREVSACPRCGLALDGPEQFVNYCPRCAAPLLETRLEAALLAAGLDDETRAAIRREAGLPG